MINAKFQIKTSRNIRQPLATAVKRNEIDAACMAHDLKISPQSLNDHVKRTDAPAKNAVEYATYLHDPKFNQQMAAIYFEAISMFDPSKWAKQFQNAPYATWFQLVSNSVVATLVSFIFHTSKFLIKLLTPIDHVIVSNFAELFCHQRR